MEDSEIYIGLWSDEVPGFKWEVATEEKKDTFVYKQVLEPTFDLGPDRGMFHSQVSDVDTKGGLIVPGSVQDDLDDERTEVLEAPGTAHLEYILLGLFGTIVLVFLICQVVIYFRNFASRRSTWSMGKRSTWSVFKRRRRKSVGGGMDSAVARSMESVWASTYDSYEAVQCRPAVTYTSRPNTLSSDLDDYKSDSRSGSEAASGSCRSESPRSCSQHGVRSTCPGSSRSSAVFVVDPGGSHTSCVSESPELNLELAITPSAAGEDEVSQQPSMVPAYGQHCLVSTAVQCENPGYETDSSSGLKPVTRLLSCGQRRSTFSDSSVTSETSSQVKQLIEARCRLETVSAEMFLHEDTSAQLEGEGVEPESLPGLSKDDAPPTPPPRSSKRHSHRGGHSSDSTLTSVSSMSEVSGRKGKAVSNRPNGPKSKRKKIKINTEDVVII